MGGATDDDDDVDILRLERQRLVRELRRLNREIEQEKIKDLSPEEIRLRWRVIRGEGDEDLT